jgi:hypothetical protein
MTAPPRIPAGGPDQSAGGAIWQKALAVARSARRRCRPAEMRGLNTTEINRLVYLQWRERPPEEVLAWHREVQEDLLSALAAAPEKWFSGRERKEEWPYDLDGHSADHRVKDIEAALAAGE